MRARSVNTDTLQAVNGMGIPCQSNYSCGGWLERQVCVWAVAAVGTWTG
jgi:hypothetical protein